MEKSPCYTCTRRSAICHAQCVAYHEWAARMREVNAASRQTADADAHTKAVTENIRRKRNRRW
jgi:hypothetical protein